MSDSGNPRLPTPGSRPPLPEITLEAVARSFHKQALNYGFSLEDFVRFANLLLGITMARGKSPESSSDNVPRVSRNTHHSLPLHGEQVAIRRFDVKTDRPLLERWLTDVEGRLFLLSTASGRAHDVDQLIASTTNLVGTIVYMGRPIGCVAYLDYSADQRRAELRKIIGEPDMRGRGLAREAAELWIGYGVGALGLRKIYLNTLATHIGNIKINEDIGFRVEGILRKEVLIDGEYHDVLRMGLFYE
jgi:RimJ/RimL family protein N-acetyltransferase